MYAVFQTGSKQYRVIKNEVICVERLYVSVGDYIKFNKILMIKEGLFLKLGDPFIQNWTITAIILAHGLAKKVKIVKFRRRKHFRKCQGHRQNFTKLKILSINNI